MFKKTLATIRNTFTSKPSRSFLSATAALSLLATTLPGVAAADQAPEPALLVIGASWANGNLPLDRELNGVWGGLNVGLGSYLDLGNALVKDPRLPGYVINEAEAGGSTIRHRDCTLEGGTVCGPALWISYEEQLERALRRVAVPGVPGAYNAQYVVITPGNDCLHSNNDDVPEVETSPCTLAEVDGYVDRMIDLGQQVMDLGMTPIYVGYPESYEVDLVMPRAFFWFIDIPTWDYMAAQYESRVPVELPGAVLIDWGKFEHNGDGIHQSDKTSRKLAAKIADHISNN